MKKVNSMLFLLGFFFFTSTIFPSEAQKNEGHSDWSYQGETGPEYWGELNSKYQLAKTGKKQSPIDITTTTLAPELKELQLSYHLPTVDITNNGHTIQMNYLPNYFQFQENKYNFLQFHFHTPSEHKINGASYPMEVHLVHKSAAGELAVIGIFFKEGAENLFLKEFWTQLPSQIKTQQKSNFSFNLLQLFPKNKSYYTYEGSLTTPPCTEGVRWILMQHTIEASKEQIKKFSEIIGKNARPIQPLHGRKVKNFLAQAQKKNNSPKEK